MGNRSMRGETAIIGIGETTYYKRGRSPDAEFKLVVEAILKACEDAGISPKEIDGFASYSNDRNEPTRLAAALDINDLRFSNMEWGGGGGGGSAACAHAASAVATGLADTVVVFRGLAQGQFGRFGQGARVDKIRGDAAYTAPYGLMSPAQSFAMRVHRLYHDHGIRQDALKAVSLASYHHAQNNPRAVMYGRPLSPEDYDNSRWIVEPFHLFDCCQENDGAGRPDLRLQRARQGLPPSTRLPARRRRRLRQPRRPPAPTTPPTTPPPTSKPSPPACTRWPRSSPKRSTSRRSTRTSPAAS